MISLLKTNNELGIKLFWVFEISIAKNKGLFMNEYTLLIGIHKYFIAIKLGKETKSGTKSKQQLKESKDTYASA
tara:strand:- start:13837 stop:14058 length:222 start_codon:yes stop_codon:yes gene_type:complete